MCHQKLYKTCFVRLPLLKQLLSCLSLGIEVPVIASFLGQLFDKIKSAFDAGDMETARKYQVSFSIYIECVRGNLA